jgi:hypothetical protein
MNQQDIKGLFFPNGNLQGYKLTNDDFQTFLFDKYFVDQLVQIIDSRYSVSDREIILVYPENSGPLFINMAQKNPKLAIIESDDYNREHGITLDNNYKNSRLSTVQRIYASNPFSYIQPNNILVIRDDNINTKKIVNDLYDMGFSNPVVVIGGNYDKKFWDNLPVSNWQMDKIDQNKNPNLNSLLKYPLLESKFNRSVQNIPIHTFEIKKNYRPADRKKLIQNLDRYYNPISLTESERDEPRASDIYGVGKFPEIVQFFPPTKNENKLYLNLEQISNGLYYEVVQKLTDYLSSQVDQLQQKTLHHFDYQNPITILPMAPLFQKVNVYRPKIPLNRIYDKNDKTNYFNRVLFNSENFVLKYVLPQYPKITNIDYGIDYKYLITELKNGDVLLITNSDYLLEDIVNDILNTKLRNITVMYVDSQNVKSKLKSNEVEMIGTINLNIEPFYNKLIKTTIQPIVDMIQFKMDKDRYRISLDLYVIRPTKISEDVEKLVEEIQTSIQAELEEEEPKVPGEEMFLDLKQDLFQYIDDFEVLTEFCKVIIDEFPTLSPDSVRVIAQATLNKIKNGVVYRPEIEKMIEIVFPKIKNM